MALDPYSLCPCGSGKKVKFCCQPILGDIEKIERLIDGGQMALAVQNLDALRKSHRGNPLVLVQRAAIHFSQDEWEESKGVLEELLHAHPDNGEANVMYAYACFMVDGYAAARPALQRAFQRAAGHPTLVAALAGAITEEMLSSRKYLAGREYLTLALRWIGDDMKQRVFLNLLELDGDRGVLYPLRGPHALQSWSGSDEENKEFAKASRLASLTCWDSAGRHFLHLSEKHPQDAALVHNLALSRAYMGDEVEAAQLLHKAARLHTNYEAAVECETIAQLLDISGGPGRDLLQTRCFQVGSVPKLLTKLSLNDRFIRKPEDAEPEEDSDEPILAATYDILSASPPPLAEATVDSADRLPVSIGWMTVYDAKPEVGMAAQAFLTYYQSGYAATEAYVLESAGGELSTIEGREAETAPFGLLEPYRQIENRPYIPEGASLRLRRDIYRQVWDRRVGETWATTPQPFLDGKNPREAIGVAELKIPLAAALFVLDAFSEQHDQAIDLPALCQEYGVEPLAAMHPAADTPVQTLSSMQMHRLVVKELSDDQLRFVLNRELLTHQHRYLHEVLVEALNRSAVRDTIDLDRVYTTLIGLCKQRGRRDESMEWLNKAIELYRNQPGAFEAMFKWESLQISLRADDPHDPELKPLIHRYFEHYGRKIPNLDRVLGNVLARLGVDLPDDLIPHSHDHDHDHGHGRGATSAGGIWTPDSASAAGGEKKLILPGQY